MARPYPVIFRLNTVTTESWGDVDVSTCQLAMYDGSIKFETALFWNMEDDDPNDPGTTVVEITYKGGRQAQINHARWVDPRRIEIRIKETIDKLKEQAANA